MLGNIKNKQLVVLEWIVVVLWSNSINLSIPGLLDVDNAKNEVISIIRSSFLRRFSLIGFHQ